MAQIAEIDSGTDGEKQDSLLWPELSAEFVRGAWFAWDAVLGWINSQDRQVIDKAELYRHVMHLRPVQLQQENGYQGRLRRADAIIARAVKAARGG